jgi:hypothetical protein
LEKHSQQSIFIRSATACKMYLDQTFTPIKL